MLLSDCQNDDRGRYHIRPLLASLSRLLCGQLLRADNLSRCTSLLSALLPFHVLASHVKFNVQSHNYLLYELKVGINHSPTLARSLDIH